MIYDEFTNEPVENPDLTIGKIYSEQKLIKHIDEQIVVLEGTICEETPEGLRTIVPAQDITETVQKYHKYTIDELVQQQKREIEQKIIQLDDNKKLELLLKSFSSQDYPVDEDPGVGYKWIPAFDKDKGFIWQSEFDIDAFGTENQPLYWNNEMRVWKDYYYKDIDNNIKIALKNGIPESFEDKEYFKSI